MACKNSVQSIAQKLGGIFRIIIPGAPKIPAPLVALGAPSRSGLDKNIIASRIISRFPEIGLINGPAPDGSQNVMEAFAALIVEEMVNGITQEARVDLGIPIGMAMIGGSGANAGGPIYVTSTNLSPIGGYGIIS